MFIISRNSRNSTNRFSAIECLHPGGGHLGRNKIHFEFTCDNCAEFDVIAQ